MTTANHTQARDDYFRQRSLAILLDSADWGLVTFGHVFVAFTLAWMLTPDRGYLVAFTWATALAVAVVAQALYSNRYKDDSDEFDSATVDRHLRWFTLSAVAVGVLWAAAGLVLYPVQDEELRLFLVFVMGGMSLAAVGTQHVYLPVCFASMSYAIPTLGLRYVIDGHIVEPILLMLYTAVLIRLARMLSQFSRRANELQFERDVLLQQLTARAEELEVAKEAADEANAAKSRFLAHASHDLRQPLHAIGLFIETIATDNLGDRAARVVDRVQHSLGALTRLFDSLLDITKLDTDQTDVNIQSFHLAELFEQLNRDFQPIAREGDVSLKFSKTSLAIATDPEFFRRLLQNLIANAIRYAPGARVVVGVRRQAGGVCKVQVIDTGPGIAPGDQRRVFAEFVRLDSSGKGLSTPGLGLGLSIVKRVADMLGLQVRIESVLGQGSVFSVCDVPLATGPPVALSESAPVSAPNLLHQARILVIDDDIEVLEATGNLLSQWGCDVRAEESIPADLEFVDIVVSDVELANGVDGLNELANLRRRHGTSLVLISGNTSEELRERASAQCVTLLHKPVRPVQLRSALLHALTQSK